MTTTIIDREQLDARIVEFVMNPLVEALGNLTPQAIDSIASDDSDIAKRVRAIREEAEELAYESFFAPDGDNFEATFYLLDFCAPSALTKLSQDINTLAQVWAFSGYLLTQYPEVREDPESAVSDLIYGSGNSWLIAVIKELIGGAKQPPNLAKGAPTPFAEINHVNASSLYETVIVHGTWANYAPWWREQSGQQNFWAYIKQYCQHLFGVGSEFGWSGKNTNPDREQGARDFINWWRTVGEPKSLQVIAHSHGCNVVYLACMMEPRLHVANMVSLGCPARTWYPPPIDTVSGISRIHNIYSRYDIAQLLGSIGGRRGEGRTLADSVHIRNHHIPWENSGTKVVQVGHTDLHEPSVWHNNSLAAKTLL